MSCATYLEQLITQISADAEADLDLFVATNGSVATSHVRAIIGNFHMSHQFLPSVRKDARNI